MKPIVRTLVGLVLGWIGTRLLASLGRLRSGPGLARTAHRRNFVRNAALGATGIATAVTTALFGGLMWPNKTGAFGSVVTIGAGDVPAPNAAPYRHNAGHFYLVRNNDGLLALWWKCPHLGCTVPYVGPPDVPNAFQCPCHGSRYNLEGVLTGGPAPRPMDLMSVTVDDAGNVLVNTGDRSERAGYAPEQAIPYTA